MDKQEQKIRDKIERERFIKTMISIFKLITFGFFGLVLIGGFGIVKGAWIGNDAMSIIGAIYCFGALITYSLVIIMLLLFPQYLNNINKNKENKK